ncbi:MAG: chemotaxis protein CheA [bacterium]
METTTDYSLLLDPEMMEIFDSFIVETKEILENLDLDLVELETRKNDTELLNRIFRSFHTIKGTSGFLGLNKLQGLTHKCEDILNKLRKGEAIVNDEIMEGILSAYDNIKQLLDVIENQKNENHNVNNCLDHLQRIIEKLESPTKEVEVPVKKEVKIPEPTIEEPEKEEKTVEKKSPAKKGRKKKLKEEPVAEPTPAEEIKPEIIAAEQIEIKAEEEEEETEKSEVEQNQEDAPAQKTAEVQKNAAGKLSENTIRVDVTRLDDLLNIVSELVLGRNRLAQLNIEMGFEHEGTKLARDLADTTRQIDLMTTELQLAVMKTRMIKIGKVFNRFPRLVRDLSKETGKDIQLVIKGEETELDKTLIEEINDPLVHIVRNSIDHGVEPPDARVKSGKSAQGTIILSAEHEGNNIVISIHDDGRGIDPEKIKAKAISKGILTREKADEMSRQDILNLIFLPGFSTAEKVTNVSGRGVGMDVVKTNVAKLRGIINIDSRVGQGTDIFIKLPLTLAIIQGLLVQISNETVVVPLNSVLEVVRISKKQIYSVNQTECIKLRDSVLPLLSIDRVLYNGNSNGHDKDWTYIVVIGVAEKRFGLKVDDLIGQKEVVIKSLGSYLGNIDGIAGSTIMGDGKVVIILDVAEIINKLLDRH